MLRKTRAGVIVIAGLVSLTGGGVRGQGAPPLQPAPTPVASHSTDPASAFPHDADHMAPAVQTEILATICVQCHTDRRKPGGVSFEHKTIDDVARDGDLAERVIA